MTAEPSPSAAALRAAFDAPGPCSVGVEEELFLADPATGGEAPVAAEVLARVPDGAGIKAELPAAQVEIVLPPRAHADGVAEALRRSRAALREACGDRARPFAAGVHPLAPGRGTLMAGARYDLTRDAYGSVAERQLVGALQVHVAVRGADRALAVLNALRAYLPELAALAANGPVHEGRDTGLASFRPAISAMLPRQGVPPVVPSWEWLAGAFRWGAAAGGVPEPRRWWWELRPHPAHGTLELRVPDAQTTPEEAESVVAVGHALAAWLADRHDAGDLPPPAETWRLAENRWAAMRAGVEAELADLDTGRSAPARDRLHALLDALEPVAQRLGGAGGLARARDLVEENGALRQRAVLREQGAAALPGWLAGRLLGA